MKATKFIIPFLLFLAITVSAQSSVHSIDKLKNTNQLFEKETEVKLSSNSNKQLTKSVFGFLPYWEIYQSSTNIRLDLLSHIAIFDFLLTDDGSLLPPPGWPEDWLQIINNAQANDIKILMTVSNLPPGGVDPELVSNLINNQPAKETFFAEVKTQIESYNLDGINLDFEALKIDERGDPINNFTQELRDSLDTWFNGKELSFATPAVNWGSYWKLDELAEICDYLFIMGYDYHGSWSTNAGPVAPLTGNNNYSSRNYTRTINEDYAGIDSDKLILGVPYYGAEWIVDTNNPYTTVVPEGEVNSNWIGHIDYENVDWGSISSSVYFDDISQTTYYLTENESNYNLLWIDNESSLFFKYDFILNKQLKGVGIWSLGKDGSHNELWNLIEDYFTDSTTSVEEEKMSEEFVLDQNYPNPFNPTTTINFTIPTPPHPSPYQGEGAREGLVLLRVYDILGKEVATLLNQKLQSGNHSVIWDATNFPSGVYYYTLTQGTFRQSRKMILIK